MKYFLLFFSLFIVQLNAFSITDSIQDAIYTNPLIDVEKEQLNIEFKDLDEINSQYLPSIDISFSMGPETTKTVSNNGESVSLLRRESSINLKQNIFSGFKTLNSAKNKKSLILSQQHNLQYVANSLALDTALAYIEVMKNISLYKIAQENVIVHNKYLQQIKEQLDAGIAINSDYVQTLSRTENVRSAEYLAEQNYLIATYTLQRLSPNINLNDLDTPIMGQLPATTADKLFAIALEKNINLQVSKYDIKASHSAIDSVNSQYYPSIDMALNFYSNDSVHGAGYETESNPNPISEDSGYYGLVMINYNLFNGFATSAQKELQKHILLKKMATQKDIKLFIKANIKVAFITNKITKKRLIYMDKNIEASKQTVSDYLEEYELGRRSIIDLLNIELEYNNARNLKINAQYEYLKSYYQLLSYTGHLLKDMHIVIR